MPDPSYAVIYFPIHGRAEPIRLLLVSLGLPFEERNITRENWLAMKAEMPLGQAPVLVEIDADGGETMIPQSQAILRHLARVHGRYGRDEAEMVRADVVAETAHDARNVFAPLLAPQVRGKDPVALRVAVEERLPVVLARLEKLKAEGPESGLFVEERPTWADCVAFDLLDALLCIAPGALDPFPGLLAFVEAMRRFPGIDTYLESRRPSELAPLRAVLETGLPL